MALVGVVMGSKADLPLMQATLDVLDEMGIQYDVDVMSAHRNPSKVEKFAKNARKNGYSVLVGAAGMAAHLAGALKSNSTLPVIGVPLTGGMKDGLDSLLSTVQMPKGVPVATMAVGKAGAINAAILSAEIISLNNSSLVKKLDEFKKNGAKL